MCIRDRWRARVGKEKAANISARSAGRGTKYHSIAEDYFNNKLDLKEYKKYPLPVLMFQHSRDVLDRINNIYLQEAALYSDQLEVAGRVDCIAEFDGVLSIIDFKTAAEPKKDSYLYDYFVQETAYACCLQEIYGLRVKQLVTIVACEKRRDTGQDCSSQKGIPFAINPVHRRIPDTIWKKRTYWKINL